MEKEESEEEEEEEEESVESSEEEEPEVPWTLDDSSFKERKQKADSRDYVDTPKVRRGGGGEGGGGTPVTGQRLPTCTARRSFRRPSTWTSTAC
jgi:hypothetical protein